MSCCHDAYPLCNEVHGIGHGAIIFLAPDSGRCFDQKASVGVGYRGGALLPGGHGGHRWAVMAGALSLASILPAAFSPRAGLLEDVAVFQADGGDAAAPDATGVQVDEIGLQSQAQG